MKNPISNNAWLVFIVSIIVGMFIHLILGIDSIIVGGVIGMIGGAGTMTIAILDYFSENNK